MSTPSATKRKRAVAGKSRAWWQWIAGAGLLGAAIVLAVIRYVPGVIPLMAQTLTVEPRRIVVDAGLTATDRIPALPGEYAGANVLLVTLDTTRADRIGCYGNPDIATPTLDGIARRGVIFSDALAPAPTTVPSHASILTGLYPFHHGARNNAIFRLADAQQTLAEILRTAGYATSAVISAYVLDSRFGLEQGFDQYIDDFSDGVAPGRFRFVERKADRTTDRAIQWLREHGSDKFFLWVHYFDPHGDYSPPPPYAERYASNPYDGEIAFTDGQLGRLLDEVEALGLTDQTLLVVAGDHGEALGQHEESTHGVLLYDATLRVPFLVACGRRLGGGIHVDRPVCLVDIAPTILSLLGVPFPATDGIDLTQPETGPRAFYFEAFEGLVAHGFAPLLAVRDGPLKYIHGPNPELYDVSQDPFEEHDLLASRPQDSAALNDRLTDFYAGNLESALALTPNVVLTPDDRRKFDVLGYVTPMAANAPASAAPDPKRMMKALHRVEAAVLAIPHIGLDRAIRELEVLAREYPDQYFVQRYLAECYEEKGDLAKAEAAMSRVIGSYANHAAALLMLANFKAARGDQDGALQAYELVLQHSPDELVALCRAGWLLANRLQFDRAIDLLRRALEIVPDDQNVANKLVEVYASAGRGDEAVEFLRARLARDPRLAALRIALAGLLLQQGHDADAVALLREGIELEPQQFELANNLAVILATSEDENVRAAAQAAVLMERVCDETGFQHPNYLYTLCVAYAAMLRMQETVSLAERAELLARQSGQLGLAQAIAQDLAGWRALAEQGVSPTLRIGPGERPAGTQPAATEKP